MTPGPSGRRRQQRVALLFASLAILSIPTVITLVERYGWDGRVREIDVSRLGEFPLDARRDGDGAIPADWRALDGHKVILRGEMYAPSSASSRVSEFQVVDHDDVARRAPPLVQTRVFATVRPAGTLPNYTGHIVEVHGTLRVGAERADGGDIESVFRMDVDRVSRFAAGGGPGFSDRLLSSVCTGVLGLILAWLGWTVWVAHRQNRALSAERVGHCVRCGYDLRASTGRCPECGTPFERRAPV